MLYLSSVRCGDVVVRNLRHHGHGLAHAAHVHVLDLEGALGRVGTSTTPMHAARALATMPLRVFSRRELKTLRAFTSGSTGRRVFRIAFGCSSEISRPPFFFSGLISAKFKMKWRAFASTNFSCSGLGQSQVCLPSVF